MAVLELRMRDQLYLGIHKEMCSAEFVDIWEDEMKRLMRSLIIANYKKLNIVKFGTTKEGLFVIDVQKALEILATEPCINKYQVLRIAQTKEYKMGSSVPAQTPNPLPLE
jgi:hypothetical protein